MKTTIEKEELPNGFEYPEEFVRFVNHQEVKSGALSGLPPWVFAAEEMWALEESGNIFGIKLIPFAQAEHQDKLAYFNAINCCEVWEANPWKGVILGKYSNFNSWLAKTQNESAEFVTENPQYKGKEFWYGNA